MGAPGSGEAITVKSVEFISLGKEKTGHTTSQETAGRAAHLRAVPERVSPKARVGENMAGFVFPGG